MLILPLTGSPKWGASYPLAGAWPDPIPLIFELLVTYFQCVELRRRTTQCAQEPVSPVQKKKFTYGSQGDMSITTAAAAVASVLFVVGGACWICRKNSGTNDDDDYEYDGNSKTRIRHGNL